MYMHACMFVISARGTPTGTWLALLCKVRIANVTEDVNGGKIALCFCFYGPKISFLVETKIVFVV